MDVTIYFATEEHYGYKSKPFTPGSEEELRERKSAADALGCLRKEHLGKDLKAVRFEDVLVGLEKDVESTGPRTIQKYVIEWAAVIKQKERHVFSASAMSCQ